MFTCPVKYVLDLQRGAKALEFQLNLKMVLGF